MSDTVNNYDYDKYHIDLGLAALEEYRQKPFTFNDKNNARLIGNLVFTLTKQRDKYKEDYEFLMSQFDDIFDEAVDMEEALKRTKEVKWWKKLWNRLRKKKKEIQMRIAWK